MFTYPIFQDNKPAGQLEVCREGLYTVFTARCARGSDRLRLAVFGETDSAYLGLMLPTEDGSLFLQKRLTRLEREKLPDPILFAAEEGRTPREDPGVPEPEPREDEIWTPAPDGTLRRTVQGRELVAVPVERVHVPGVPRELLQTIRGREYLVFPI